MALVIVAVVVAQVFMLRIDGRRTFGDELDPVDDGGFSGAGQGP